MKGHARDMMSPHVVCATPETSLYEAAERLGEGPFGGLPIVSPEHEVIGFLSATDLMGALLAGKSPGTPASALMSTPADVIDEFAPASEVMRTMRERCIHHLPVVRAGKLVGILSPKDVLRYFVLNSPRPEAC